MMEVCEDMEEKERRNKISTSILALIIITIVVAFSYWIGRFLSKG